MLAWRRVLVRRGAASAKTLRLRVKPTQPNLLLQRTSGSRFFSDIENNENENDESQEASRFLRLAEEEEEGEEGEEEEEEEDRGDFGLDEDEEDINAGGYEPDDQLEEFMYELYLEDPVTWSPFNLAAVSGLTKPRIEAMLYLKAEEHGLTLEELRAQAKEAKTASEKRSKEVQDKLALALAQGNEQEVKRLEKKQSETFEQVATNNVVDELTPEEVERVKGKVDEGYRNPEFFFLNDNFDGYPPMTRRLHKRGSTDKLQQAEAQQLQRLAKEKSKKVSADGSVPELPSFAMPSDKQRRWKTAVRDITHHKAPMLIRDESRVLRLAHEDETVSRSWVQRPPYFNGI